MTATSVRIFHATRNRFLFHVAGVVIGKQTMRRNGVLSSLAGGTGPTNLCSSLSCHDVQIAKDQFACRRTPNANSGSDKLAR
jgi:hypothetical protein